MHTLRDDVRVLFVCLHNAGRSQMSQGLFERAADGRHEARSAGTTPAEHVHPEVIEVMNELGIDLTDRTPQLLTRDLAEWADIIVTMGCGDQCPFIPGKRYIDWDLRTRRASQSTKSARPATRSPAESVSSSPNSIPSKPAERLRLDVENPPTAPTTG